MADGTAIEWTDATWNPVVGCSIVSPGCTNCYAMKLAGSRLKNTPSRQGLTIDTKAGPVWNGEVRFMDKWLDQPLRWKRPRRIFVCAHGDLFAENVPDEWIDRVFAVMAGARQHTFQVLTKRARRMREYLTAHERHGDFQPMMRIIEAARRQRPADLYNMTDWPLPNVWLGVSAEDQVRADERVPELLATPAAIRFVSAEPLLGPIEFRDIHDGIDSLRRRTGCRLDWIILGGESGQRARPMHPAWARSIRDQCAAAGVAFFFKQWGKWASIEQSDAADEAGWQGIGNWMILSTDGDLDIPDHRWPDEDAGEVAVIDVGKKRAGRLLDAVEHSAFPDAR